MASKRKAKFKVGQVVRSRYGYHEITARFESAEGVGIGLRWRYNIHTAYTGFLKDASESELRPLTRREKGERNGK